MISTESFLTGREYYHISNAMQYSNTTLDTTSSVMYDPIRVAMWCHFFF